ncbi:MAG: zf-HC2 domain-containing protein [Candidatus Brocadiia bacterium]|jgi:predicted anti-sigma-YlaC factor YlaD|nr:zf-HC2 domain-containing protein [Candidatus Brocadiia bacterium]
MNCEQTRETLVDLMEGALDAASERVVREHVEGCSACREEFGRLGLGRVALLDSLQALAPDGGHLTRQRLRRLREGGAGARATSKIVTLRRFVGAAAAAVILVCAFYIAGDIRSIVRDTDVATLAEVAVGDSRPAPGAESVMLTAAHASAASRDEVGYFVPGLREGDRPMEGRRMMRVIRSHALDVEAPVRNVLYDAEETGYWW